MDNIDLQIINKLQYGFPICDEPYKESAKEFGLTEDELLTRINTLFEEKYLTRFGPMYNAEKMGGSLSLAAMSIKEEDFERVCKVVNAMPEIAHNYQRDHELNMWFVVATEEPEGLEKTIQEIELGTGYPVFNMPKQEEFYVGFYLNL